MTLLDDPSIAPTDQSDGALPSRSFASAGSWRFAARLARREVQRRPGRTLLVVLLVAVPVLAMTIASVLFRTNDETHADRFAREFGTADLVARSDVEVSALAAALPAGSRTTIVTEWSWTGIRADNGRRAVATIVDLDPADELVSGVLELTRGRLPGVGEVVISSDLADRLGLGIGDRLRARDFGVDAEVVGFARLARDFRIPIVLGPSLDLFSGGIGVSESLLIALPPDADVAAVRADLVAGASPSGVAPSVLDGESGYYTVGDPADRWRAVLFGWIAGALFLAVLGIIVAAAFSVSARRQLVTVGVMSANGADPSAVRRVLALQGAWSGAAGAVLGVTTGLVGLLLAKGFVESVIAHRLGGYRFSGSDLAAIGITGIAAATLAAFVPARAISQMPTLAALGGRRPLGRVPRRLVPVGLAIFTLGVILLTLVAAAVSGGGQADGEEFFALVGILGGVGVLVGACCASPLAVGLLGPVGERIGGIGRLAARSLARGRTRSAAVVSAIAVAGAAAVALSAGFASQARQYELEQRAAPISVEGSDGAATNPPPGNVTVFPVQNYFAPVGQVGTISPPPALDRQVIDDLTAVLPELTWSPLRTAFYQPDPSALSEGEFLDPQIPVGNSALLDLLGFTEADRAELERVGAMWLWPQSDPTELTLQTIDGPVAMRAAGPSSNTLSSSVPIPVSGPGIVITEAKAESLGFEIIETSAVGILPGSMTLDQQERLQDAFPSTFLPVLGGTAADSSWATTVNWSWVDPGPGLSPARLQLIVAVVAVVFVLLVVAIGLALAATESKDERDVLLAVGARPGSLRRVAAVKGAYLALAGAVISVPTGLVPFWAVWRAAATMYVYVPTTEGFEQAAAPVAVPWLTISALVLAIPLIAALGAWFASAVAHTVKPVRMSTLAHD